MNYQSPTNYKDSHLILGIWRSIDIAIIGIASMISFILIVFYLIIIEGRNIGVLILLALPAIIAILLTLHLPLYQNIYGYLYSVVNFHKSNRLWIWAGIEQISKSERITEGENDETN